MAHNDNNWGQAIGAGLVIGVLSTFTSVRVIFVAVLALVLGLFLWDQWVTAKVLDESSYEFTISEPILDEMDGGRPATISPLFNYEWKFVNKSEYLIESFTLNGELFRCDSYDQPLDSCDYIRRENFSASLNLPAGRKTTEKDQFSFTNPSGMPGIYRAKIWASDVYADSDREF